MDDLTNGKGRETRYYTALGSACDALLRCKDCRQLVLRTTLVQLGCCACGCKRMTEITILTEAEMAQIQTDPWDFPHRDLFLQEFAPVG